MGISLLGLLIHILPSYRCGKSRYHSYAKTAECNGPWLSCRYVCTQSATCIQPPVATRRNPNIIMRTQKDALYTVCMYLDTQALYAVYMHLVFCVHRRTIAIILCKKQKTASCYIDGDEQTLHEAYHGNAGRDMQGLDE